LPPFVIFSGRKEAACLGRELGFAFLLPDAEVVVQAGPFPLNPLGQVLRGFTEQGRFPPCGRTASSRPPH